MAWGLFFMAAKQSERALSYRLEDAASARFSSWSISINEEDCDILDGFLCQ